MDDILFLGGRGSCALSCLQGCKASASEKRNVFLSLAHGGKTKHAKPLSLLEPEMRKYLVHCPSVFSFLCPVVCPKAEMALQQNHLHVSNADLGLVKQVTAGWSLNL